MLKCAGCGYAGFRSPFKRYTPKLHLSTLTVRLDIHLLRFKKQSDSTALSQAIHIRITGKDDHTAQSYNVVPEKGERYRDVRVTGAKACRGSPRRNRIPTC